MAKGTKWFFFIIAIIIMAGGLVYWKYQHDISTPVDKNSTEDISFQIKKGETPKEIGKNLKEESIISSDFFFYWYTKFHNFGEKIIAGRFVLTKSMNIKEIVQTIIDPSKAEYIITIQEGLAAKNIDEKLVELGLIKAGEFLEEVRKFNGWEYYAFLDKKTLEKLDLPVEGYLYPDTYFLDPLDFKPHDMIYKAMDNFEKKTAEVLPEIKNHTLNEIITMASIIENEVYGAENRKIVSGILWKRLDNGWKLDADSTLLYITDDRIISEEDLQIDSPYNTRKNKGLPPGPICNPSLESIEAAMYPNESEYWFYLTTKEGEVIYAKTNEEQNQNREKYL